MAEYIIEEQAVGDVVRVIRCKDCVYHHDEGNILYCDRIYGVEEGDMYAVSLPVMPDDYCSRGEKRIKKVVRCGECKYAKKISQSWLGPDLYCVSCERLCDEFESYSIPMNENDFCSRGERKEETQNEID